MLFTEPLHQTRTHSASSAHFQCGHTTLVEGKMAQGLGHDGGTSKLGREWRGLGRGWASVSQHDDQGKAGYPESELDQEKNSVVGAVVPALHEERVTACARKRACTLSPASETSLMNAVTPVLPVDVVSKSLQEMVKVAPKPEHAAEPVLGRVSTHLHGGRRWRCVVAGFVGRGPTARGTRANCSVIEYDRPVQWEEDFVNGSTHHVHVREESRRFFYRGVVDGSYHRLGILFRFRTWILPHYSRVRRRANIDFQSSNNDETYVLPDRNINTVGDERIWRSRCSKGMCSADSECLKHPKSEASALIVLTTKSTKKLIVEPLATVELSLCSAVFSGFTCHLVICHGVQGSSLTSLRRIYLFHWIQQIREVTRELRDIVARICGQLQRWRYSRKAGGLHGVSGSQKYLHPKRFLMTQIWNVLPWSHHKYIQYSSPQKRPKKWGKHDNRDYDGPLQKANWNFSTASREVWLETWLQLITKSSTKEANQGRIIDTRLWYNIQLLDGFSRTHAKQKHFQETGKEFTDISWAALIVKIHILWELVGICQILWRSIIVLPHLIDVRRMGICRKSSAQNKGRNVCSIDANRPGWKLVGGFWKVLLLFAKHWRLSSGNTLYERRFGEPCKGLIILSFRWSKVEHGKFSQIECRWKKHRRC